MLQQVAIYVAGDDDPESNNGGSATAEEWAIDYFKSISKRYVLGFGTFTNLCLATFSFDFRMFTISRFE